MILLKDFMVATGSYRGPIELFITENKSKGFLVPDSKKNIEWNFSKSLDEHEGLIFSLALLSNGNLVSASWDDTIKIWNPYLEEMNLLLTITGHGVRDKMIQLGVLSNTNLVACSNERNRVNTLRIWNSENGQSYNSRM